MFGQLLVASIGSSRVWMVGAVVVMLIVHEKLRIRLLHHRMAECHRRSIQAQTLAGSYERN